MSTAYVAVARIRGVADPRLEFWFINRSKAFERLLGSREISVIQTSLDGFHALLTSIRTLLKVRKA